MFVHFFLTFDEIIIVVDKITQRNIKIFIALTIHEQKKLNKTIYKFNTTCLTTMKKKIYKKSIFSKKNNKKRKRNSTHFIIFFEFRF